jgi:hypothetical protein
MTTDTIGEKLKRSRSISCAAQCREMGLVVGDTIVGRETHSNGDWSEAKLTALFIGREECVFDTMSRNNYTPSWIPDGESADWTLDCRDWHKIRSTE